MRIATDPNYPQGYGWRVSDAHEPEPPADPPTDTPESPAAEEPAAEAAGAAPPDAPGTAPPATPDVVPVAPVETGYSAGGVPTFDYVREKIETRFGTSAGAAELAAETPEGRSIDEQYEARQHAAAERLAQIRESMKNEDS